MTTINLMSSSEMTTRVEQSGYIPRVDYVELPETPPAHIWALKALRNQLLGTRHSPIATPNHVDDDIDELSLPPQASSQPSPSSPSKGGILKTPGTISRRKSVTFNNHSSTTDYARCETPKDKRTSILSRDFPGKYPSPSPYTPRNRQPARDPRSDNNTDLIPVSRSALETLAAHVELLLENNSRLQQIIASSDLQKAYSPYSAHPDLETMKCELEHEKQVLKEHFADFEQQQVDIKRREEDLNAKYMALADEMKEQHALQSSTANIVEDYQHTIQQLNAALKEDREAHIREVSGLQTTIEGCENKIKELQRQVDDAADMFREHGQEIESRDMLLAESQEKLRKTQRQLSQLKMETLEARVGPSSQTLSDMEWGTKPGYRRLGSRRTVSSTSIAPSVPETKPSETLLEDRRKIGPPISFDVPGIEVSRKALLPRNINVEESQVQPAKAPGQDAIARRAAAAKRLEERQRNREKLGKENSCI